MPDFEKKKYIYIYIYMTHFCPGAGSMATYRSSLACETGYGTAGGKIMVSLRRKRTCRDCRRGQFTDSAE